MAKAGAPPKFREAHLNWVFWIIGNNEPIGRKTIVEKTGLGEGSIRTILKRLIDYELITSAKKGAKLSKSGKNVFEKLSSKVLVRNIELVELTSNREGTIILVRNSADLVTDGVAQRDEAVRVDGGNITTIVYRGGRFKVANPGEDIDITEKFKDELGSIDDVFSLNDGDVIIISSEGSIQKSEECAWMAASTLLE